MRQPRRIRRPLFLSALMALSLVAVATAGCGGSSAVGAGRGLVLLSFGQAGVDNAVLNTRLEFRFSESVDPATITNASIQIREGDAFGATVAGVLLVNGSVVIFEPQLPSLCDQSDSAFKPDTEYRVQVIGFPEQFSIRNMSGQPLDQTTTYQFHTRLDTDPDKFADQIPGIGPKVLSTSPADGDQAVAVAPGNRIEIDISENLGPCSVDDTSILIHMYEQGDPTLFADVPGTTRKSGFTDTGAPGGDTADQAPLDHTTWGAGGAVTSFAGNPRKVVSEIKLVQDFNSTRIFITPLFGFNPDPLKNKSKFPENALIVIQFTFNVLDFGNLPITPFTFAFTTENLNGNSSEYLIENKGETTYDQGLTTADVNTNRSPEIVQGYMLFAGDGDNGVLDEVPSLPQTVVSGCTLDLQPNSGTPNDFDPAANVIFDTGATPNFCPNATDGSTAVVWEFNTFRVRNGITVRIIGANPAIVLVQGDVLIEFGGQLVCAGGDGDDGEAGPNQQGDVKEGKGVAGGGDGGTAIDANADAKYGDDGFAGFGSPDYDPAMIDDGVGEDGLGAGRAGQPAGASTSSPWDGSSAGGGGGGHAEVGKPGDKNSGSNWALKLTPRGEGGGVYEGSLNSGDRLQQPEAGSGGGSAGHSNGKPWRTSSTYEQSGGAGGAGGGFVDITSSGDITILGMVDGSGGDGGDGAVWTNVRAASGGGGGGSGGSIRLLTPNDIVLSTTSIVTVAGGRGGQGPSPRTTPSNRNHGGDGGHGRIAMETGSSIVSGLGAANVTPTEGALGFYRGPFDAARFKGGGLTPVAVSDPISIGNHQGLNPTYTQPGAADFISGVPTSGAPGINKTAILIEAKGFQMKADGTADLATETPWFSVGHFLDSGIPTLPNWVNGHPPIADVPVPSDNAGLGNQTFAALNAWAGGGYEILSVRITMYLPTTVGPFDPGSFLDDWTIKFTHDQ